MPLRDYLCESCGHLQEELIRRDEDERDLRCTECGGTALARQLSAPAAFGGGESCSDTGGG